MNFTKCQNKLTNEEIRFFEKIFENEEIKRNLNKNHAKFRNHFICFYILSWISFCSIIISFFLEIKIVTFTSFWLFLFFIFLGIFLWKTSKAWTLENYQISQIIFKEIFKMLSPNGIYKNPNWDDLLKKMSFLETLQAIRFLPIFYFSIWDIEITWNKHNTTRKIYLSNRQQSFSSYFLNYTIDIKWKNFESIIFAKKWENKKNLYAWIVIIVTLTNFLLFIFIKHFSDLENIFNNHWEVLLMVFSLLWMATIWTIKEYIQLKNQHNQQDSEFLKNFDIISENKDAINSLNTDIFQHLANLSKIDENINIIFNKDKIIFRKKIPKTPHFHNSLNSTQKNISQYIQFYLEMKEIFYILTRI